MTLAEENDKFASLHRSFFAERLATLLVNGLCHFEWRSCQPNIAAVVITSYYVYKIIFNMLTKARIVSQ